MSVECFRAKNFGPDARDRIDECNTIVRNYAGQGLRLTLRQLYYQLVSQNVITNEEKSYKNLGGLVSDARLAGLMDWESIEDRVRVPKSVTEWESMSELVDAAADQYRLPRWRTQQHYTELWVEKDALAGVLWPLAHEFHVTMMVNRGYSSQSAMYEAAQRYKDQERWAGDESRLLSLLYLGDHDPSGEDMVRDIQDRLSMFEVEVAVVKIALTTAQVQRYKPPPNPAKITDSRAKAYIQKHGPSSWEVDALPPKVLQKLIRAALTHCVDRDAMDEVIAREEVHKKELRRVVAGLVRKGKL